MKRVLPSVAVLSLVLAACVAGREPVYLKPGTPSLLAEEEFLSCAAGAGRDFPDRTRPRAFPNVVLGANVCEGNFCVGGYNGGASYYDRYRDRNEALRDRAVNACMAGKGYTLTSLPECPRGTRGSALRSQPYDTTGLCVVEGRIVAPGQAVR